jgi:hypothetical protein
MACSTTLTERVRRRGALALRTRACGWLVISGLALATLTGCTAFQRTETSKWFDTSFLDNGSNRASQVMTIWDTQVRLTQNSANGGTPLAGMAGRLYLFNDMTGKAVEATGKVVVQMHDVTHVDQGKTPDKIAEWTFDPVSLKRLRRTDTVGEGYTLFLPWESYSPAVKSVRLQVCYVPDEKGNPYYGEPFVAKLQTEAPPVHSLQERVVPASNLVPQR